MAPICHTWYTLFCARPKIDLHIVPVTNLLCQTKRSFTFSKGFCASTKFFEPALNAIQFLVYSKTFTSTKHFRTCRRTWHKFWAFFPLQYQLSHFWHLFLKQKAKNQITQLIIQESDKMSLFCIIYIRIISDSSLLLKKLNNQWLQGGHWSCYKYLQRWSACVRHLLCNLFVTAKNKTTSSPIYEFKVLHKDQRAF